jgi:hypothetical protein
MSPEQLVEYVKTLRLVSKEIAEYASSVEKDPVADWNSAWGTYTLEAIGAVYQLLKDDKII